MSDMWKSDSVYILRVLSGIVGEPSAGVMSWRSLRKEVISKASSSLMLTVSGTSPQSAFVMPFPMMTIELHNDRIISSLKPNLVSIGSIDSKIARAEVVACLQGEVFLVVIGKEYLSTMGLASAVREDDSAPLVYMSWSDE